MTTVLVPHDWAPLELRAFLRGWVPRTRLGEVIARCFPHLPPDIAAELFDRVRCAVVMESSLALVHWHGARSDTPGRRDDYGVVSRKFVTNNGVALIVDALDNTLANADIRYHGVGTGVGAESASDSALGTESTTILNPDSTRATGTFSQPSANISQSVGTNTFDGAGAITEHGIFTQAATGGGTLLDRSQFSAVNVISGDSIQSTYALTLTSGG